MPLLVARYAGNEVGDLLGISTGHDVGRHHALPEALLGDPLGAFGRQPLLTVCSTRLRPA